MPSDVLCNFERQTGEVISDMPAYGHRRRDADTKLPTVQSAQKMLEVQSQFLDRVADALW